MLHDVREITVNSNMLSKEYEICNNNYETQ